MSQPESSGLPLTGSIAGAAARLMSGCGHQGFTMGALARESGVSRATLYRLAGSRDEVLAGRGHAVEARVEVRERILAACRVVFTWAGFDAATLDDIAREAGVGVARSGRVIRGAWRRRSPGCCLRLSCGRRSTAGRYPMRKKRRASSRTCS